MMDKIIMEAIRRLVIEVVNMAADDLVLSGFVKIEDIKGVRNSLQKSANSILANTFVFIEPIIEHKRK